MKSLMSFLGSLASKSNNWLIMASATKSSILLPRKTIRSLRRRPMTSDSAPRIADSCVCDISIEAFANLSGDGEVLKGGEMSLAGLRERLLGFGKEE